MLYNVVQDLFLKEDHPLAFNLTFAISIGLLPVTLSLRTASCGIQNSGLADEETGDIEHSSKEYALADLLFLSAILWL